jgi:maltooligosyltrehalose trehalohydrolase
VKAIQHGFAFTGEYSAYRGLSFGRSTAGLSNHQFIVFGQNHDQVGNRLQGDRLIHHLDEASYLLYAAMVIWSPFTPLLFMGEEYGEERPFPFFVDHGNDHLLRQTREGRQHYFGQHGDDLTAMPDPGAESTFLSAKLDPRRSGSIYTFYREALAVRRQFWPLRVRDMLAHSATEFVDDVIGLLLPLQTGQQLIVIFNLRETAWNLSDAPQSFDVGTADLRCSTGPIDDQLPGKAAGVWLQKD